MNPDYKYLLDGNFSPASRVWIYQSSRLFTMQEALDIEEQLNDFAANWKSHDEQVTATAHLFFGQFIVLIADEEKTGVSGCSTDSSVRLVKAMEVQYGVNLFDRTSLAFVIKDKVQLLPLSQLQYAFDNQFITEDTLYFNNLVATKRELEEKWIIPVKESWLMNKISFSKPVL
jgi:hypothetical protein